jgi:hypothetical protein
VLVGRSPRHATHPAAGLATRLRHAETALTALPPRGRGKRHSTDEAPLRAALARVLQDPRVDGRRSVAWAKQGEQPTQDGGRGRGSGHREQGVLQQTRSHLTHIARPADTSAELCPRLGGQALGTKAAPKRLSLPEAGRCYRHADRVDRLCHRLKSRGHSAPLCVKLNEHREGLTSLLPRGVRVCTGTACVRRRSRETEQATRPGWPPEHKPQMPDKPTAERLLTALADLALTIIKHAAGEDLVRRLTPLSG